MQIFGPYRKGRGNLSQAKGDDELDHKGDNQAEDTDLRSAIDEALAEVALTAH